MSPINWVKLDVISSPVGEINKQQLFLQSKSWTPKPPTQIFFEKSSKVPQTLTLSHPSVQFAHLVHNFQQPSKVRRRSASDRQTERQGPTHAETTHEGGRAGGAKVRKQRNRNDLEALPFFFLFFFIAPPPTFFPSFLGMDRMYWIPESEAAKAAQECRGNQPPNTFFVCTRFLLWGRWNVVTELNIKAFIYEQAPSWPSSDTHVNSLPESPETCPILFPLN